jgi:MFS family permease
VFPGTFPAVRSPGFPSRIFRGWYVLAALFVGGSAVYGVGVYSFFLFVKPLSDEFHWSYAVTGSLVAAFYFSAPLSLMTDWLIRHVGIKRLAMGGILIEASALICFPMASELWQMYLLRALGGVGKILYIVTLPIILSKWFSRRFSIAVAIMGTGWQLGGVTFAPVTEYLIHAVGWRSASMILGVAVLAIALPATLWMLHVESAAEIGLGLDGDPFPTEISPTDSPRDDHVPTDKAGTPGSLGELLRHGGFQLMVVASGFYILTYCGVLALQPTTVEATGVSARTASAVLGSTTAFAAVGGLLGGYVIDRFSLTLGTMIQYSLIGSGVLALLMFTHLVWGWLLVVHAITFGLAVGGTTPLWMTVLKRKVPAEQFARAWGIYYFLGVASAVVAPIGAGRLRDLTGNFTAALATELALVAVSMPVCLILVRRPEVHTQAAA